MCDCLTPIKPHKCLNCLIELQRIQEEYCGLDKEDAWEGIALQCELAVEDELDEIMPAEYYLLTESWI